MAGQAKKARKGGGLEPKCRGGNLHPISIPDLGIEAIVLSSIITNPGQLPQLCHNRIIAQTQTKQRIKLKLHYFDMLLTCCSTCRIEHCRL